MKKLSLFLQLLAASFSAHSQKPAIDTNVYGGWRKLGNSQLSSNGAYAWFSIDNQPLGSSTLVIKSTQTGWKMEFVGGRNARFCSDDKHFVFMQGRDSLVWLHLESKSVTYLPHVKFFQIKFPLLACELNTPEKGIVIFNFRTGKQKSFSNVNLAHFYLLQTLLFLQDLGDRKMALQWIDPRDISTTTIWQGRNISNITSSPDGSKLAFVGDSGSQTGEKQIWLYVVGEAKANFLMLKDHDSSLVMNDLSWIAFGRDDNLLFFWVKRLVAKPRLNSSLASVDIFGYKDPKLQSQQLKESPQNSFLYVYNLLNGRTIRIENENERYNGADAELGGDWILITKSGSGDQSEWNWNKYSLASVYLVSTSDGTRRCLRRDIPPLNASSFKISAGGKYVTYFEPVKRDFFCYDIKSGTAKNITKGLKTNWVSEDWSDLPDSSYWYCDNILGWTPNDSAVWLKSRSDVFQAYPTGNYLPVCLSNGFGLKHHIEFKKVSEPRPRFEPSIINPLEPFLLTFINHETKEEGFCKIKANQQRNPELLSIQQCHIKSCIRAQDAELYLVEKSSAESAPNYFITRDFQTFDPLTNVHPEKKYNWLTSELIKWKTPDGKWNHGILYKPENFDPKKQYPMIVYYYERNSNDLHKFFYPENSGGRIDIPTYVSNDYLVFVPDIFYKIGHPGKSACNTVVSGVKYLLTRKYINPHKLGLQGHSWGGFETNYIITHSHLFAAAVSACGLTDFVSGYNTPAIDGHSEQSIYEMNQNRMGATLWQRPDLYIENSPVFRANKITTGVLIMANKNDQAVPYQHGIEFFTALRRLGKKAWLLQYDDEGHYLYKEVHDRPVNLGSSSLKILLDKGLKVLEFQTI